MYILTSIAYPYNDNNVMCWVFSIEPEREPKDEKKTDLDNSVILCFTRSKVVQRPKYSSMFMWRKQIVVFVFVLVYTNLHRHFIYLTPNLIFAYVIYLFNTK